MAMPFRQQPKPPDLQSSGIDKDAPEHDKVWCAQHIHGKNSKWFSAARWSGENRLSAYPRTGSGAILNFKILPAPVPPDP